MVKVDAPDVTVRVNITARESQIEKIDALAEAAGMTRSGVYGARRSRQRKKKRKTESKSRLRVANYAARAS